MKHKEPEKSSINPRRLLYVALAIIIILVPTTILLQTYFNSQTTPKAAIIDELGSSKLDAFARDENQTFLDTAEQLVHKRFSEVDFYSDNATIEQYEQLASAGYKLIIWRAHTALDQDSRYIAISATDRAGTIDPNKYSRNGHQTLTLCNITGDPTLYYAITPDFISEVMPGRFQDTVIVLMGCYGLNQGYLKTAQAFQSKGAKVVIGWDGWISSPDNDVGGTLLLQRLINDNDTVSAAANNTSFFSPDYGSASLQYFPLEAGNYQIQDYREHDVVHSSLGTLVLVKKTKEPKQPIQILSETQGNVNQMGTIGTNSCG